MKELNKNGISEVQDTLFRIADPDYKKFVTPLVPTVLPDSIIGVRMPQLRKLAQKLYGTSEGDAFLSDLPHEYYDENNLHAQMLCLCRSFEEGRASVERFLPYIDNWATCDSIRPYALKKDVRAFSSLCSKWTKSRHPYTVRFGLEMRMWFFLDEHFDRVFLDEAAAIQSDEYYVQMMVAWLFATALVKQYDAGIQYLTDHRLDPIIHRMTVRKALDSFRITPEKKQIIRRA